MRFLHRLADLAWLLRRVIAAHPGSAAVWFGSSLVSGLITPVQLWAAKGTADNLQDRLEGGAGAAMWAFAALWVAVVTLNLVAAQPEGLFTAMARERGGAALVADALAQATAIDLAAFEHQDTYDRIARVLTDAEAKANDALENAVQFGWIIPRTLSWAFVLVAFDWRLALIALVPLAPAMWGWFFAGTRYWDVYSEQTRERRLATYFSSLLTDRQAAKEVRLFGLTAELIARWERLYWATARELRNRGLWIGLRQRGMGQVTATVQMLGLAWYIAAMPDGAGAGTAVIVLTSFISLGSGILNFGQSVQRLGQAAGFATDARAFLRMPHDSAGRTGLPSAAARASELRLENVGFTYPGGAEPVLTDVSLTIRAGETVALVGENGAGKTTLVKLMLGLYRPDSGRVLLDGEDLVTLDPAKVRQRLAGVFQQVTRYPMSARDNVSLGDRHDDAHVDHALDLAGLARLPDRLPRGLDTVLAPDLGGIDLSGGQWQRLAIARAGVRDAGLLALDEPTAALDPLAEVAIFRRFAELARDRTTVLVSHRLGMARLADRIVVLEHGRIVEQGTHDELVADSTSEYAAIWDAQARWYR